MFFEVIPSKFVHILITPKFAAMQFTAQQIGILLNGTVDGNPDVTVDRLAKIEEATTYLLRTLHPQLLRLLG